MAVVAGDIKFYLSGNGTAAGSTGGAITATEVTTNALFDDVSAAEASSGDDSEYRCIYVKNTNGTDTLTAAKIFIQANTTGDDISIALDGAGKNGEAETEADESTAPTGESFSQPTNYSGGLSLGDMAAGDYYAVWIKRTIAPSTSAGTYTYTLRVQGEA